MAIVGIDFGTRRIGLAVSESQSVASPHSIVKNEGDVVQKIARIAEDLGAEEFVVGIPRRTHPSANDGKFRRFADDLRQRTCKPVTLWNESLSTVEAAEQLRASGRSRRDSEDQIDMYAAAVILQSYLDDRSRRSS